MSAEWEQRKYYLVRSLFEDVSRLSPIQESDEPESSKWFDEPPVSSSGSESTLPDLIIEREKNRHDEPEEFYQQLKIKIMKYNRELFKNKRPDVDSSEGQMEVTEARGSCMNDSRDDIDLSEVESDSCGPATEWRPSAEADRQDTSLENESTGLPSYEIFTTRAVVHREDVSDPEVLQKSPILIPNVRLVSRQALTRKLVGEETSKMTRAAAPVRVSGSLTTYSPQRGHATEREDPNEARFDSNNFSLRRKRTGSHSSVSVTHTARPSRERPHPQLEIEEEMSPAIIVEEEISREPDDIVDIISPQRDDRSPHTDAPKRKRSDCSSVSEHLPHKRKKLKGQEDWKDYFENHSPVETMRRRSTVLSSMGSIRHETSSREESLHTKLDTEQETARLRHTRSDNFIEEISDELSDRNLNMAPAQNTQLCTPPDMDASSDARSGQIADDSSGSSEVMLHRRKIFKNAEVQTSGNDAGLESRDHPLADLYLGTPLIFNLCRCTDHVCR